MCRLALNTMYWQSLLLTYAPQILRAVTRRRLANPEAPKPPSTQSPHLLRVGPEISVRLRRHGRSHVRGLHKTGLFQNAFASSSWFEGSLCAVLGSGPPAYPRVQGLLGFSLPAHSSVGHPLSWSLKRPLHRLGLCCPPGDN